MKKNLIQICSMLAVCCAWGQGTLQYDQQVSNTNPPGGYFNIKPDPSGQSFIPSLSVVGFIKLYLTDPDPNHLGATMRVNLWSGSLTNGTLLGSTDLVALPGIFLGQTNFFFSSPVSVSPGTTYYLQIVTQSGDNFQIGVVPGGLYASGTAIFHGTDQAASDLWFREGIVVPEPSSGLLALLGVAGIYFQRRKNRKN